MKFNKPVLKQKWKKMESFSFLHNSEYSTISKELCIINHSYFQHTSSYLRVPPKAVTWRQDVLKHQSCAVCTDPRCPIPAVLFPASVTPCFFIFSPQLKPELYNIKSPSVFLPLQDLELLCSIGNCAAPFS